MSEDQVAQLRRWEEAGAVWQVIARRATTMTIGLFRCDGGEEVSRFTCRDADVFAYVGSRDSSQDDLG
jgi:hypothetical protein